MSDREQAALDRRINHALHTKELVDAFSVFTLQSVLAPQEQLSEIAAHVHSELRAFRFAENAEEPVFPDSGVHLVRRRRELVHRIKMAGVLARIEYDSRLAAGDTSAVQASLRAGELVFASSEHLLNGSTLLDVYLGPLLGALSPAVWALHAAREAGVVLYSLGRPIAGTKGDAAELLQLLPIRGSLEAVPVPKVSTAACAEALEWWGARLNELFGVLTDPVVFTDKEGHYSPVKHIQCTTSVEQVFVRVGSLLAAYRDGNARRVMLFSTLDTVEKLTARNIETHCSLSFATKTLERLKTSLPAAAAEILLPGAERAVAALRRVQDGFYVLRQSGLAEIEVAEAGNVVERLSPERAAAEYVKMLRNATHGFGSNRSASMARTNALLAHHNGEIPNDLAMLGYLYLLDLLAHPNLLRATLYRNGRL